MKMKKLIWCSRHEMSGAQLEDLKKSWIRSDIEVIACENILWQATDNWHADFHHNRRLWLELIARVGVRGGIVAGVFPPVAMEAKPGHRLTFSPVSKQEKSIREDGSAKIDFVHVRWARLIK